MICLSQSTAPIGAFPGKTFRIIERIIAMYNLKETGKCVKNLRCNMTQEELATELFISVETIRKIEQGRKGMSIDVLILLADYFGVSTDFLLGRSNEVNDYKKFIHRLKKEMDKVINNELNM